MAKKMKLLEVCLSPDLGGLELFMFRCAKHFINNFDVVVAIQHESKLKKFFQEQKLSFFELDKKSKIAPIFTARKLAKIIDSEKIDIIHMHWAKDLALVCLAKKFSKYKPKIAYTRNMTMTRFKDSMYHRSLYKEVDLFVPVTKQVGEQIRQFIPKQVRGKVEPVYMGSDCFEKPYKKEIRNKYTQNDTMLVGLVGRIEESKGQWLLIKAIEELQMQGINIKALVVGHAMDEDYLNHLKQEIMQKGLTQNIEFIPFTNDVQAIMQVCDCVVLASKKETFGLVLIEAMHTKTAVVGSNQGGVLEIIDDKQTGLLFESGNSKSLAEQLKKLAKDPILREKLAENGQVKARKYFESNQQFEKLANVLKNI